MSATLTRPAATDTDALRRHTAALAPLSDCPLIEGNAVQLLPSAADTLAAMFDAIEAARQYVHLEYYTFEDVHIAGRSLADLLHAKLKQGVRLALCYDAIGSQHTPDAFFDSLQAAGAQVLEYHSVNPLRRHFAWRANDRDHRKVLVVDGRVAFLGGVNLARVYENPESAGAPTDGDTAHAFWRDAAVRIEGPAVPEIQRLFLHTWSRYGGDPLSPCAATRPSPAGDETIRVEGSAPRERRQLYYVSLRASASPSAPAILCRPTAPGSNLARRPSAASTCACCCPATATCPPPSTPAARCTAGCSAAACASSRCATRPGTRK
jgi:cardiolipin synthase